MLTGNADDPTGGVVGSPVGGTDVGDWEEWAGSVYDVRLGPAEGWPADTLAGEPRRTTSRADAAAAVMTTATAPAKAARRCRRAARRTRDSASGHGASDHRGWRSSSRSRSSSFLWPRSSPFTGSSFVDAIGLQQRPEGGQPAGS